MNIDAKQPTSIREDILIVLKSSAQPLTVTEIFERCKLATESKQVADNLCHLRNDKLIEGTKENGKPKTYSAVPGAQLTYKRRPRATTPPAGPAALASVWKGKKNKSIGKITTPKPRPAHTRTVNGSTCWALTSRRSLVLLDEHDKMHQELTLDEARELVDFMNKLRIDL